MASMINRIWTAFSPPIVEKKSDAIRFGNLGAANIAPLALIIPSNSHPEVIVQAVAARDRTKAEAFAKKNRIPEVKNSYQEMLDDPNIDAIFIPLTNNLHFEWAVRSIRAGKHVLLEKPSVSNSKEADILFNLPELSKPGAPVLLEAFHNRFHPAVQLFRSFIDPAEVVRVYTESMVPWVMAGKDSIATKYELSGGSMMAIGTYNFGLLRIIFDDEPTECLDCQTTAFDGSEKCDYKFHAKFKFPNGGIGEAKTTMRGALLWKPSEAKVTMRYFVIPDPTLPEEQQKGCVRQVILHGFVLGVIWHRVDVRDYYTIRWKMNMKIVKEWTEVQSHKAYSYDEAGGDFSGVPGEDWWMSYRYQLEAFVNRIKGRKTQYWVSGEDSRNQAKMIDIAYEKSGLGVRQASSFCEHLE